LTTSGLPQKGEALNFNAVRTIMKSTLLFDICLRSCLLFSTIFTFARADDFRLESGYVSLFNGKDLTG
jgi:hypothetical protein